MEYWDLYDKEGQLVSQKHPSSEQIPDGLYHLVVTLLIQHVNGPILLTQRSHAKKIFPGKWEATISGRVQVGEDYVAGIQRELKEELGWQLNDIELINSVVDEQFQIIIYNLYARVDVPHDPIVFNEAEISDYRWGSVEEMLLLIRQETIIEYSKRDFSLYPLVRLGEN